MATPTLRAKEFARLDEQNHIYLDYTGSSLSPTSLLRSHFTHLNQLVLGNPHSSNPTSKLSTTLVEKTRQEVLTFFNADPLKYTVIFTANASSAIKLVAESYPFRRGSTLALLADNHNSVNGMREYAKKAAANVVYLPLTRDLRAMSDLPERLQRHATRRAPSLFVYPAQSNFSGVKHPLHYTALAKKLGYHVFLDASAYVPSSQLDITQVQPDFMCVSFYKMFGFPTGVGCLIARKDALAKLQRPWFAGGTVKFASVQNGMHMLAEDHEAFEDGTVNFACVPAVMIGLRFLDDIGMDTIERHVTNMTRRLMKGILSLRYLNGRPMVKIYGPETMESRGSTVNFDMLRADGVKIDPRMVEVAANERKISLRTGCFCNPGAAEKAYGMGRSETKKCVRKVAADEFSVERFSECVGDVFVGSVRVSVGIATNRMDVDGFVRFVAEFGVMVGWNGLGVGGVGVTEEQKRMSEMGRRTSEVERRKSGVERRKSEVGERKIRRGFSFKSMRKIGIHV